MKKTLVQAIRMSRRVRSNARRSKNEDAAEDRVENDRPTQVIPIEQRAQALALGRSASLAL